MSVAEILGAASAVFGAVALVVAAAGLHWLPDAL
jgi:multisubunit Na+/H+ antiporter MnhG subunit